MLVKFHSEIGNMVRSSMMKLNNKNWLSKLKIKSAMICNTFVLNGAVVGGSLVCTCFIEIAKLETKHHTNDDH
jgi:hypothetical protein